MPRFTITEEGKKHAHSREFARTLRIAMRDLYKFGVTNEQILGQMHIAIAPTLAGRDLTRQSQKKTSRHLMRLQRSTETKLWRRGRSRSNTSNR
jgi:hypothetical protein